MTGSNGESTKRWEGWLESPCAGEPVDQPIVTVAGWAFHRESPIREVTLRCGGRRQDLIPYGNPRPDVAHVFPEEPGAMNSGFRTCTPIFASGDARDLEIWATLRDGRQEPLFSAPVAPRGQVAFRAQVSETEGERAHPEHPKVSVIIPCFNQGQFLDYAVESVLLQTYRDFEILILDDGSTDPETIRHLADYRRPRTHVFRTQNRGLAAARNFLIDRATGDFVCALDADDRLHPDYLSKALARFEADPGLTFISTWVQEFGDSSQVWRRDRCDLAALLAEDTVMTAALVRRDAVVTSGGYDEHMPAQGNEDWELWLRLVEAGHRGSIIPEALFYYRRRPGSMSTACTRGSAHLDSVRYLLRKHAGVYQEQLDAVLLAKEEHVGDLLRANDRLEREIDARLRPEIALRRAELDLLRLRLDHARARRRQEQEHQQSAAELADGAARLAAAEQRLVEQHRQYEALSREYERALDELRALRASTSWRVTSPLRAAYDLVRSLRTRRST